MERRFLQLAREPRGDEYRSLVRALGTLSLEALLVRRDDYGLGAGGEAVLEALRPSLIEEARSSSWPGTILIGHEATVFRFRVDENARTVLAAGAEGLYGWRQPERPEDLCFTRPDGSAVLTTVSHEHEARLEVDAAEYQALTAACAWLPRALGRPRR